MTRHVVIDPRTSPRQRRYFESAEAEAAYERRVAEFRQNIPVTTRYVVGMDQRVQKADGDWLEAGAPITAADLAADEGFPEHGRAAWQVLGDLVREQVVYENYAHVPAVEANG